MNYNFELSRFLDDLRKRHRITYEVYVTYRSMADTLAMENDRLEKLEDKIKSGELCNREEVRKETAREIAEMLKVAKGVIKVHFEAYDELIENIYKKYGIDLEDEE